MASTTTTMSVLNTKCLGITKPATIRPVSLLSLQKLPKGLITTLKSSDEVKISSSAMGTALAGAVFASLSSCDSAFAAQQIATLAEGTDNRGLALLLPLVPAILWVLYNILQPTLNQIRKMTNKGVIVGFGLGGLAASGFVATPSASADEIAMLADATSSDSRGLLLLFVVAPAIAWVLFNILQPALNQINKMRSN